jgi:Mn-dependent DtxR family transcriptional regulator
LKRISDPPEPADTGIDGKEVIMTSLPDRPDVDQLRTQAKELKRALAARDQAALERVLASHPKFVDRPAERADGWGFTLRDAQVTLARELGFASWRALLEDIQGPDLRRWSPSADHGLTERAFREAQKLRARYCTLEHFLLALLSADEPTIARQVLTEMGLSYEKVAAMSKRMQRPTRAKGGRSTPTFHLMQGWAQGIAVGLGYAEISDEVCLLALAYGVVGDRSILESFDVQADELVEKLRAYGVKVPSVAPPISSGLFGPQGPFVYFPPEDWTAVTGALHEQYPSGRASWGTNKSRWKRDHWYVNGDDEIPMEEIVRRALQGRPLDSIEVLSFDEGLELENAAAPLRYRDRPVKEKKP